MIRKTLLALASITVAGLTGCATQNEQNPKYQKPTLTLDETLKDARYPTNEELSTVRASPHKQPNDLYEQLKRRPALYK